MKYWIQRHDYSAQDFPEATADEAAAAFSGFDWAGELAAAGPEQGRDCPPGIGFHNGFGEAANPDPMLLHICPNDADSVLFHFHHDRHETRWLFGLLKGTAERIHTVQDYPTRRVPDLIRLFFKGRTDEILAIPGETATVSF